jgi:urease accessory protein
MRKLHTFLVAATLLFSCGAASAHPGALADAHAGLVAGLVHPFTGFDHLAAMLAIGVWSALALRPVWLAPAAFVGLLAIGALAGFAGLVVPGVEPMIAASLLAIGLLLAMQRRLHWSAAAALAGGFAFFHGAAHGAELAGQANLAALAGMLLATASLHLAGIALGRGLLARQRWLPALAGSSLAVFGATLLARLAFA